MMETGPARERSAQEPCFPGDLVQFSVIIDRKGKVRAETASVVEQDGDLDESLFSGVIKAFFPEKGWGLAVSPGVHAVHGLEDILIHRDNFGLDDCQVSDEEKIQKMTEGVQRIQEIVDKCNGRIPVDCDVGFACRKPTCPRRHPPEGREMLEDPELLLCKFKRKCRNAECFYIHMEGREIDVDPMKGMCKWQGECTNPRCMFLHPPGTGPKSSDLWERERDLTNVRCNKCGELGHMANVCSQSKCHNCGEYGHMASACRDRRIEGSEVFGVTRCYLHGKPRSKNCLGPDENGRMVCIPGQRCITGDGTESSADHRSAGSSCKRSTIVVKDLPEAWADLSDDDLKEHVSWDLSVFGPLVEESLELGPGRLEAYAQFQKQEHAQAAVDQLHGGDGELRVELRYPDENGEECAIVHLDELYLPAETEETNPLDCEVWVDNADDADVEGWHDAFGELEEIYRVPGSVAAGFPAGGAYVRFSAHESAVRVTEQGQARWSSSERALSNKRGLCGALLSSSANTLRSMREELGLRVLHLGGSGRAGSDICLRGERGVECMSTRLHFVARGPPDKLQNLRGVLELQLAGLLADHRPKKRTFASETVAANPKKPRKAPFMPSAAAFGGNNDPPGDW